MAQDYSGAVGVADTLAAQALIHALLHVYGLGSDNIKTTLTHASNQHRAAAAEIILDLAEQGYEIVKTDALG